MAQTTTNRLGLIKNTPGTGELVSIAEINSAFDAIDDNFIPACKIRATGTQSVVSGSTVKVLVDSTSFDTYAGRPEGAMADLTNDRILIRKSGLYEIKAGVAFVNHATGYRGVYIRKNGAAFVAREIKDRNNENLVDTTVHISQLMDLAASDFVEAWCIQTSGAALNADPSLGGATDVNYLSAVWLGKAP